MNKRTKKHIVICLNTLEYSQLKTISENQKMDMDEFIIDAVERSIQRILGGQGCDTEVHKTKKGKYVRKSSE